MRWFLDTEFNDRVDRIELISIAMVSESGHEYYAHCDDYDVGACGDWLQQNVLPHVQKLIPLPMPRIAAGIQQMIARGGGVPEFWAYYASYDWVLFCKLFGGLLKLPPKYPRYCHDLKQLIDDRGIDSMELPKQTGPQHDALADARWVRESFLWVTSR
jgi:hypothetical protein